MAMNGKRRFGTETMGENVLFVVHLCLTTQNWPKNGILQKMGNYYQQTSILVPIRSFGGSVKKGTNGRPLQPAEIMAVDVLVVLDV